MKKKRFGRIFAGFLAVGGVVAILVSGLMMGSTYAANEGGSTGSGGLTGCGGAGWTLDTCYGAAWRYYKLADGQDGEYIKGKSSGTFAAPGQISGCADAGGYWRYAMVAYGTGKYSDGSYYSAGDQVGLIGISANSSNTYNSEFFGGGMNYIPDNAWDTVRDEYDYWSKIYPSIFTLGFDSSSNLAWFCAGEPGDRGSEFLAKSDVTNSGANSATTGITKTNKKAETSAASAVVGSTVNISFKHNVYATKASTPIEWTMSFTQSGGGGASVSPSFSGGARGGTATSGATKTDGYYLGNPSPVSAGSYTVTINQAGTYTFCEKLSVKDGPTTEVCTTIKAGEITTGNCNMWLGQSGYGSGHTSVISAVKNSNLSGAYSGWQGRINGDKLTYAMPTDPIVWQNCYYPGAQKNYNKNVTTINDIWVVGEKSHSGCSNKYGDYKTFHTQAIPGEWTNEYKVSTDSPYGFNLPSFSFKYSSPFVNLIDHFKGGKDGMLADGDVRVRDHANNYDTKMDDVGQRYQDEIETTGTPNYTHVSTIAHECWYRRCCSSSECGTHCCGEDCEYDCCNTCTVERCHYINDATRNDGYLSSKAEVLIPYNFINTTHFSLDRTPVYSGEEVRVLNARAHVGVKANSLTERTYATQVDGAQVKLFAYVAPNDQTAQDGIEGAFSCSSQKQCKEVRSHSGTLNESVAGLHTGKDEYMFSGQYNAFDASAGDYMCFAMAVYPATSGADNNLKPNGDGKWYIQRECRVIAKRPSFQVYGGSLYTSGNVSTSVAKKHNIYSAYGYEQSSKTNTTIFGSWVEQSTVVLGQATLLASGAGTGLAGTSAGSGSLEGGSVNYCKNRTTLSMANFGGANDFGMMICPIVQATGMAGIQPSTTNRKALVDFWATGDANASGTITPGYGEVISSATGVKVVFSNGGDSNLTVNGATVGAATTHIIRTNGSVTVNDSIKYVAGEFSSAGQIPKVVIYAGKDININCGVTQLDAIIIAEGKVNTCANASGDDNDSARANQLNIRGMIIANELELGRTYGAAAYPSKVWNNSAYQLPSSVPAEAINYDTSAILWGRYMSGAAESDTMTVTYQHELAPRY